jgi:hypothetical protein
MSGKTVYRLQFLNDEEEHFFGSIAAIFDEFTPEQIGVSKSRLWACKISPENPYKNKICTITKGKIIRKKGGRAK